MWAVNDRTPRSARRRLLGSIAGAALLPWPGRGAAQRHPVEPVPLYAARIPPAVTLHYALRRGILSGQGQLAWRHDGRSYEARMQGSVAGLRILTQVSLGGFDAAGLAPLRFSDQRLHRRPKVATFDRNAGRITFSDAPDEYPIVPGAQDRLSWMIQLAAIAAARPQQMTAGAGIALFVVGARGDGRHWSFQLVGREPVPAGRGTVSAVKLERQAHEPDDTQAEVWLDPDRHWLPVRARLTPQPEGDALDLLFESSEPAA